MNAYIERDITPIVKKLASKFPIVTITGPRQSGKSTLLKHQFPEFQYLSLEDIETREMAFSDPKDFVRRYPDKVIIDEIQRAPELLSYLQVHVDSAEKTGIYLLSGSQSFMLMKGLSQSLAGRTALLTLLPFSRNELKKARRLPEMLEQQIFTGFYPRLFNYDIEPADYYPPYIQTYVERDVRNILNVTNLSKFIKFLRLCAGRIGQILNMTSLATETGVTSTTAEAWLSVLETSYICYRLEPYFKNFNKRIIKSHKLYFYDTGLACNLLGVQDYRQLETFYMRGALFENLVINQFVKDTYNHGNRPDLSYWRDSRGQEVDLIQSLALQTYAYEIKSGATFHQDFFKNLDLWGELSDTPIENRAVIYAGEQQFATSHGKIISFPSFFKD